MGNICNCLNNKAEEQAYTPIETVETVQPKSRPVERSGNNYQTIIDRASGNFISSKTRSKPEAIANSSEGAQSVRERLSKAEVNPQIVCSPPATGIVLQSYASFANNSSSNQRNGQSGSPERTAPTSAISSLQSKPTISPLLEKSADELALIVMKQKDRNVDKFSNSPNDCSAVVGFKPFEGSINSR